MKRRIAVLALLGLPLSMAVAQAGRKRLLVFDPQGGELAEAKADQFRSSLGKRLAVLGWPPEKLEIEVASATGANARAVAEKLVASRPDVFYTPNQFFAVTLQEATRRIPIVALMGMDPVRGGVAKSLREPGGNVTGFSLGVEETLHAHLNLLRQLLPGIRAIHTFASPVKMPNDDFHLRLIEDAGFEVHGWASLQELDASLASKPSRNAAFVVPTFMPRGGYKTIEDGQRAAAAVALRHRLPSIGIEMSFVEAGGLLSFVMRYDAGVEDRKALMIDKLLRGADPGKIPFETPMIQEFGINRKTAEQLALRIPAEWILRATRVI